MKNNEKRDMVFLKYPDPILVSTRLEINNRTKTRIILVYIISTLILVLSIIFSIKNLVTSIILFILLLAISIICITFLQTINKFQNELNKKFYIGLSKKSIIINSENINRKNIIKIYIIKHETINRYIGFLIEENNIRNFIKFSLNLYTEIEPFILQLQNEVGPVEYIDYPKFIKLCRERV